MSNTTILIYSESNPEILSAFDVAEEFIARQYLAHCRSIGVTDAVMEKSTGTLEEAQEVLERICG